MADNFIVNRGIESKISKAPIQSGALWLTEDGRNLYLDSKDGTQRIHITDVIDLSVESPETYYSNKIYIDGYKLKKYNKDTGLLDTISDLESEVLKSNNEFVYDTTDVTIATLKDNTLPKKGTVVIDKNGDVGIVTSSNDTTLTVAILSNNKSKNILTGYDIYFDSDYNGPQIGTIECPFSEWNTLYETCKTILEGTANVVIHLKANSTLKINALNTSVQNVIFAGHGTEIVSFNRNDVTDWKYVTFNQVDIRRHNVDSDDEVELMMIEPIKFVQCQQLHFKGCVIQFMELNACSYIYVNDCDQIGDIRLTENSDYVYINNSTISNGLGIYDTNNYVKISNCHIRQLYSAEKNGSEQIHSIKYLDIVNTTIDDTLLLYNIDEISLMSGALITAKNCEISANKIDIGTFDFNGAATTFEGTVNDISGLSSIQVYDNTTDRTYGKPSDKTLKAHLDKIGESIGQLNEAVLSASSVANSFVSKGTFYDIDKLNGEFRTGDVMTYVAEATANLDFTHKLTGDSFSESSQYDFEAVNYKGGVNKFSDLPTDAIIDEAYMVLFNDDETERDTLYKFNGEGWEPVDAESIVFYTFTLENAAYYAKYNNGVNLLNYADTNYFTESPGVELDKSVNLIVPVHVVNDDKITVKIKYNDLYNKVSEDIKRLFNYVYDGLDHENQVKHFMADVVLQEQENAYLNQTIRVSHKDRLIRLTNGWDKLSGSTDGIAGNYHIVSNYRLLSSIDNDETRLIGTLAYVQSDDQLYQWRYKDGSTTLKEWAVASLGGGGVAGMQAIIEKDDSIIVEQYRDDNSAFKLHVIVKKCTTGNLRCTHRFGDDTATSAPITVPVLGPDVYVINVDNIPDKSGVLSLSVKFESTDDNVLSPESNLRYTFYIGEVLSVNNVYFKYSLPNDANYTEKTYVLDSETSVKSLTTRGEQLSATDFAGGELQIGYKVTNVDVDTPFKIRYKIINKLNNEIVYSLDNSEGTILTSNYLDFPLIKNNSNYMNIGYYELQLQVYNNLMTSETFVLPFIIDSCNKPYSMVLNSEDETLSTEDSLYGKMVILYNNNSTNNEFTVQSLVDDSNNINRCTNSSIETSLKSNINTDVHDILMSIEEKEINALYSCYFKVKLSSESTYVNSVNKKQIIFTEQGYVQIVSSDDSNIMYALDSRQKSNLSNTKHDWNSVYTNYFGNKSAVTLNNFTFFSNGWVVNTDENGKDTTTLTFDGDGTYATINMNPLIQKSSSKYNVKLGYTFEIKFKSTELYKNSTVLQCLDAQNRGIIIRDNEVIFSPYSNIYDTNKDVEDKLTSRLTRNEWHTITFVLLPKNELTIDNVYNKYFTNKQVPGDSAAMLFIDGIMSGLVVDTESNGYYTTEDKSDDKIYLGASYDKLTNSYDNFSKMQIMHIACYNKALSPSEILTNFIAYNHDLPSQSRLKVLNGYDEDTNTFGNASDELIPVLTISNAYLAALDAKTKNDAKNFIFPNVGITLTYKGITLINKYGCELKAQGTSSMSYPIKNYKITHYNFDTPQNLADIVKDASTGLQSNTYGTMFDKSANKCKKQYKNAKGEWESYEKHPVSVNGWLPEHTFTLKADFMESTHCRNAGTAMFVNEYMNKVPPMLAGSKYDTPSNKQLVSKTLDDITKGRVTAATYNEGELVNPIDRLQNAIAGFPCILQYVYTTENGQQTVNKGIYMFDVDKNAEYIFGYNKYDTSCKSYEVSNNNTGEDASGAAAFDLDIINNEHDSYRSLKNDIEVRYHCNGDDAINAVDETLKLGYVYDENDDTNSANRQLKTDADVLTENEDYHSELKHLYMWLQDCVTVNPDGTKSYNYTKFKNEINEHFDLDNLLRYIILTKVLGMTDNLAKNMMITTWDAGTENITYIQDKDKNITGINYNINNTFAKWYLQFYDLDTSMGLTNDGHNKYPTSLDITGHNDVYDNDGNLISTKGLKIDKDEYDVNLNAYKKAYSVSDITYDRYNGFNSLLWKLILGAYDSVIVAIGNRNEIQTKYAQLRETILTLDNLKKYYFEKISDNIGQHYYNVDALNKYFGHNYLSTNDEYRYVCLGSAKNHITDWLENRLMYWDSYYMYDSKAWTFRTYPTQTISTLFGIDVVAPTYVALTMSDTNQDGIQSLCTSQDTNIISTRAGYDWAATMYNVNYINKLTLSSMLNLGELNLGDFDKLTSLNISSLSTVSNIIINSSVLQQLQLSESSGVAAINVSQLNELIELDISDSNISSIVFSKDTYSNTSIKRLNIENSKITTLDLSTLTNLESLNKLDMTKYSYNSFIDKLLSWKIISDRNITSLDDKTYIDRLANQFKNYLIKNVDNITIDNTLTSTDLLNYILTNYRAKLGKQFIPHLAIINTMNRYDNKISCAAFTDVKIYSNNIKAIHFDYDTVENKANLYFGSGNGNLDIKSDSVKYVYINRIGITSGNIYLNIPNVEDLYLYNSTYDKPLDLSKCTKLQTLEVTNFTALPGITISKNLRNNNILQHMNFRYNYRMKYFRDASQSFEDTLDFNGLNDILFLNLYDVYGFTNLSNLQINNYSSSAYAFNCLGVGYNYNAPADAYIKNCSFKTSSNSVSLHSMFGSRNNLHFDFNNGGLNMDDLLAKCISLNYAFSNCYKLTYAEATSYVLNKWIYDGPKTCEGTFVGCLAVGRNIPNDKVTTAMFPNTLKSVTNASKMYMGILGSYSTNNNKLILVEGAMDYLENVTDICGILSASEVHTEYYHFSDVNSNSETPPTKSISVFYSYVKAMPYNILRKCTKLQQIGQGMSQVYTLWAGPASDKLYIIRPNDDASFNEVLDGIENALPSYEFLFAYTKDLVHVKNIDNLSNQSRVTINSTILNNANKYSGTNYSFMGAFSNHKGYITCSMINSLSSSITYNMSHMFYNVGQNVGGLSPTIFLTDITNAKSDKIKASNMSFMFAKSSLTYGTLLPYRQNTSVSYTDKLTGETRYNYMLLNSTFTDKFSILTGQDKVTDTSGMFYNCSNLYGNVKIISDNNSSSTVREFTDVKDISDAFFNDAVKLENAAYMFNGCDKLNIWFDDFNDKNVYLFEKNKNLNNISYMFANSSLKHSLPNYGNKGSQMSDCKYFYYDITKQVKAWADSKNLDGEPGVGFGYPNSKSIVDTTHNFRAFIIKNEIKEANNERENLRSKYEWLCNEKILTDSGKTLNETYNSEIMSTIKQGGTVKSPSEFVWDYILNNTIDMINTWDNNHNIVKQYHATYGLTFNAVDKYRDALLTAIYNGYDNRDKRIYNFVNMQNRSDYTAKFSKSFVYQNTADNTITIYQYYNDCKVDDNAIYMGDSTKTHLEFLNNNGFLYIDAPINPLTSITGLFKNTKINGGIPNNIFNNLTKINNLNYVFSKCSYLGLTDGDLQTTITDIANVSKYRNNTDSTVKNVTPSYIIPYGLLDKCSNVTQLNYLFEDVFYLSRPYDTWDGNTKEYSPGDLYEGSDRNDATYYGNTSIFDEVYIIPKYFLHYLPALTSCEALFKGNSGTNNLFGHLYYNMFEKNTNLTNISYMFYRTHVYGCEEIPQEYVNTAYGGARIGTRYYIGERLLSPLNNLSDASYLFDKCTDLLNIVLVYTTGTNVSDYETAIDRDLVFRTNIHGNLTYLKTVNMIFINSNNYHASAIGRTNNANIKLKLVHNTNSSNFAGDKQCYEVFTASYQNNTCLKIYNS